MGDQQLMEGEIYNTFYSSTAQRLSSNGVDTIEKKNKEDIV